MMIAIGIAIARINIMKLSSVLCKVTEARNCEALERCVFEVDICVGVGLKLRSQSSGFIRPRRVAAGPRGIHEGWGMMSTEIVASSGDGGVSSSDWF